MFNHQRLLIVFRVFGTRRSIFLAIIPVLGISKCCISYHQIAPPQRYFTHCYILTFIVTVACGCGAQFLITSNFPVPVVYFYKLGSAVQYKRGYGLSALLLGYHYRLPIRAVNNKATNLPTVSRSRISRADILCVRFILSSMIEIGLQRATPPWCKGSGGGVKSCQ